MKSKCYIIIALFSFLLSAKIIDSSDHKRPAWSRETPKGIYYNYFSGVGYSEESLTDAKAQAESDVVSSLLKSNEFIAKSKITTNRSQIDNKVTSNVSREIEQTGPATTIEGLTEEEVYWEILTHKSLFGLIEKKSYRYWMLMKQIRPEYIDLDKTHYIPKQSYGIAPIIKSTLIPGWGQSHKGQKTESIKFLSSFFLTITLGFLSEGLSDNYSQDAKNAIGGEWINYYNKLSEQYYLLSRASYTLATGIYGYNIYHAISTRGAKIYALNNNINFYISIHGLDKSYPSINLTLIN